MQQEPGVANQNQDATLFSIHHDDAMNELLEGNNDLLNEQVTSK